MRLLLGYQLVATFLSIWSPAGSSHGIRTTQRRSSPTQMPKPKFYQWFAASIEFRAQYDIFPANSLAKKSSQKRDQARKGPVLLCVKDKSQPAWSKFRVPTSLRGGESKRKKEKKEAKLRCARSMVHSRGTIPVELGVEVRSRRAV